MRLTVAQALVRYLAAQYTERDGERRRLIAGVFGIFGHGNLPGLGEALLRGQELSLPFYRFQNEQAMVHAAIAYAKHSDRLSTFACTSSIGPGATNMVTGAAAATINRLPVLLLPADYFANRLPDPVLQQLEHPLDFDASVNDAFRPVARFFARITRPEQLLAALPQAMRVLTDPADTGAVVLALPEDVQTEAYDWPEDFFAEKVWRMRRPPPEPEVVAQVAELLRRSERPLLIAGGGVRYSRASEALARFAEVHGIPVAETQAGKGSLPWDHPLNVGPVGASGGFAANRLAEEADLVLAVGTRLTDFPTASKTLFQNPGARFVGVNVAPADAHKLGALALVADAKLALEALDEALVGYTTSKAYRQEVEKLRQAWLAEQEGLRQGKGSLSQAETIALVNDLFPEAVAINAAGSMPGDLLKLWRTRDPKGYHVEYGYSTMGYEIPAGLGVRLADPSREVVVFIGDGSYLMMNSEIVTARAYGLSFVVILVENRGFQSIHGLQRSLGSPEFGNELRDARGNPLAVDFPAHARALGAQVWEAWDREGLRRALEEAKGAGGVRVVVAHVDPEARTPSYGFWDVPVAEVSEFPEVRQARRRYEEALRRRKLRF
ncbi:3D-(3,5/4)-trihydroxycyclohexane-1,2-dione acylhydrolase (decyclizing) (plasmid) [Thermus thermophilus]|uniref:Acetolactate synthase n=2 Tax=Thermus thermophilus TaxID=274 RepID=F6DJ42_THETG|nr:MULTISPECIES: 3D-(3,5/4)-trihydroxycyclohexane-1,2-dione acylhydrolase (decyclizing) [Thermus]AEG34439.1 Acetolactate synthase [Thermus thermophilus SG0.5JP17-16]BCZ90751.1 3D-(3,5/4)-trihydroxycyclohexane-1,2-dione acylhydrolase (decyclizing) [Thermus thermophilus]BCZ93282.1 3D-(3,5/4)-trihydroxycyclohexane-1,2-dione acylhydrolase (decyclizing) [Thermus thermophilus]VCU54592.1 3D-(3,5/4)-trihydroxycyclohexane-1,2-dione hydrolase [Thermus thermophilus]